MYIQVETEIQFWRISLIIPNWPLYDFVIKQYK